MRKQVWNIQMVYQLYQTNDSLQQIHISHNWENRYIDGYNLQLAARKMYKIIITIACNLFKLILLMQYNTHIWMLLMIGVGSNV